MGVEVREYVAEELPAMAAIWNRVVEDGMAFPQLKALTDAEAAEFFSTQTTRVAVDEAGRVLGLYILHPNNVGRAASIANASYAVAPDARGQHVGQALVTDCLAQAAREHYRVLQFNAVVDSNAAARALYAKLGFVDLGVIPACFLDKHGDFEDIHVMYHTL